MTNKSQNEKLVPVVGIGASSGGLKTLQSFFSHVPENSGMAYVVVMHLSPDHKSILAELIQPNIKIPVMQVNKTIELKPNHVYVIPPNAHLDAIDSHLRLSKLKNNRFKEGPIDHFFRTLAKTHDGDAIGIILSGAGFDGTLGVKEIKEKGGLTIVQDPQDAEFDSMPQSAISTGLVDIILPVKEMPSYFIKFFSTKPKLKLLDPEAKKDNSEQQIIQKIFSQVHARTGRDFSRYKTSTLLRRLQRRMQIHQITILSDYLELLQKNPEEVQTLSDDFLINVTNFFRDTEAYHYLENIIIPRIVKNKDTNEQLRVWSSGCATGEEAYSLAMILYEAISKMDNPPSIQIFASDLHEKSLAKAREGFYPGDIKADVSEERLNRFFIKEDSGYRIQKELRELVIFTSHNLMGDPPFSKLDLLVCRNVLIYLKKDIQQEVIELFHYALLPQAYLMLGLSEQLDNPDFFNTISKEFSFFSKRNVPAPEPRLPVFPKAKIDYNPPPRPQTNERDISVGSIHYKMIEKYGPPSLLLSNNYHILHVSGTAGEYLQVSGGEFTKDVFKLIKKELQFEFRSTLYSAKENQDFAESKPTKIEINGKIKQVVFTAKYIKEEQLILVIFKDFIKSAPLTEKTKHGKEHIQPKLVAQLEKELDETRKRLQAVVEEYETSQEEMKASNEELHSANEELRSAMEELETSKEELQSMNEELITLNQENKHKVEELAQLSDDLQNLLYATDIATLFLDRDMHILRFTPKLGQIFNIRPADKGRQITDITNHLGYDTLTNDAQKVLKYLHPIEKEAKDKKGNTYLARVLPYQSSEDKIEGVVITFVDISVQKKSEFALKESKEFAERIVDTLHEPLVILYPNLTVKSANQAFYNQFHVKKEETIDRKIYNLGNGQWDITALRELLSKVLTENSIFNDYEVEHEFEHIGKKIILLNARRLESLELILLGIRDITQKKQHEIELKRSKQQIATALEKEQEITALRSQFISTVAHEFRTPLASIHSNIQLLHRYDDKWDKSQKEKNFNRIYDAIKTLSLLLDNVAILEKDQHGKIELKSEPVNFRRFINALVEETNEAYSKKLSIIIENNFPDKKISIDKILFRNIFINLFTNALKYSSVDSSYPEIHISDKKDTKHIHCVVRDYGMGIKQDELKNIYEPFYRGSNVGMIKGTGLGISIVKKSIELLKGTLDIQSKEGEGTTITTEIPYK